MKKMETIRKMFKIKHVCSVDYRCSVCQKIIPAGEYHNSVEEFMLLLSGNFEIPKNENINNGVLIL